MKKYTVSYRKRRTEVHEGTGNSTRTGRPERRGLELEDRGTKTGTVERRGSEVGPRVRGVRFGTGEAGERPRKTPFGDSEGKDHVFDEWGGTSRSSGTESGSGEPGPGQ